MIDLRSDTLTKPTVAMRTAMANAEVGDDVYGEDPTVRELEERVAGVFGKEAALFTPTGSMANLLAVGALVGRGEEVLCAHDAHIARAELGTHATVLGISIRTWQGSPLELGAVEQLFAPDTDPYLVATRAVSVENTHNFSGGRIIPIERLRALRSFADERRIGVQMDGARIWNAHVATGTPLAAYGAIADVMTVCLSKGLGAPIGSLVLGTTAAIRGARVWRKRVGGGMRQVGVLAAAGLHALDHHVERLAEDHEHARVIAAAIGAPVPDSNIVVVGVEDSAATVALAAERGVRINPLGPRAIRLVTHLDVSRAGAQKAAQLLAELLA